jgi:hypothetical protein
MRFVRVCVVACIVLASSLPLATAQARSRAPALAPECNVSMRCDAPVSSVMAPRHGSSNEARNSRHAALPQAERGPRETFAYAPATAPLARESGASPSTSMAGVVPALAAKVAQIQSACPGAHVISTIRHTRIRGSGRLSLHATGEAVDMRGNPSCVYAQLRGWAGGYSTDYGRARHIHISLAANGREAGLRFAHGGKSHRHRAFARR